MLLLIFSLFGFANDFKAVEFLSSALLNYRNTSLVELKVEKTLKSEYKPKDSISNGKIFYSKGKFRWENETPQKMLTVFDGNILWNVQYSSLDFPGKNKVAKSKLDKKARSQIFLMSLFDEDKLVEKFEIKVDEKNEKEVLFSIDQKSADKVVYDIKMKLGIESKKILEVSFKDDIGNLTIIKFENEKMNLKKKKGIFSFKPGKNDEVTEI